MYLETTHDTHMRDLFKSLIRIYYTLKIKRCTYPNFNFLSVSFEFLLNVHFIDAIKLFTANSFDNTKFDDCLVNSSAHSVLSSHIEFENGLQIA